MLVDTFNRGTGPGDTAISVATCRTREPVTAAAARLAPGLRLTEIPDYFSWTLPLRDEALHDADSATLHEAATALARPSHPAVQRLVAEADVPATFPVHITSVRPVAPWRVPNVTLLGDAIHTMSPGRGEGATIALRDAQLLRDALIDVTTGQAPSPGPRSGTSGRCCTAASKPSTTHSANPSHQPAHNRGITARSQVAR